MEHVRIGSYGDYSSNYGLIAQKIKIGSTVIYFSYKTPVAIYTPETGLKVCENVWSKTTGKHLNWINKNKKERLPYDEFQKLLESVQCKAEVI